MSNENPVNLKYKKTIKVNQTNNTHVSKGKQYLNKTRRVVIPNAIYDAIPEEIRQYNTIELEYDLKNMRLIYTFKTPPPN